ncbi:MAG: helix-turn-helix transcriptional regulator [Anaerolineales bacterium]|nr:helix-turn-helix transcriptional regulator [Anaerolineales bacterium]
MTDPVPNLISELRGGTFVLAVLSRLEEEQYGYALSQQLAEKGMAVDQGTLYPLLRRLEKQGLLESRWSVEGSQPRRYYKLGKQGREALRILRGEWRSLSAAINRLTGKDS